MTQILNNHSVNGFISGMPAEVEARIRRCRPG